MIRPMLLTLVASLVIVVDAPRQEMARADMQKLQGTWVAVAVELAGQKLPEQQARQLEVVIKGDKYAYKFGGQTYHGTYKLDPIRNPKAVDSRATDGVRAGTTFAGIYALEKDTLKVCFPTPGEERPTQFVSPPGSRSLVATLKRACP
jgi:uncharacterized protein (TIGR03067 family)